MNRMLALIKREFWENKGAFRTTPLAIGGIYIVVMLMFIITFNHLDNEFQSLKELIRFIAQLDTGIRGKFIYESTLALSMMFSTVLAFVVFFYPAGRKIPRRRAPSKTSSTAPVWIHK